MTVSIVTAVSQGNDLPKEFELLQNYPNPFKQSTTIPFTLTQTSEVRIIVYNGLGIQVDELNLGNLPAGYFDTTFDAAGFASGIYIYRLATTTFKQSRYMILYR